MEKTMEQMLAEVKSLGDAVAKRDEEIKKFGAALEQTGNEIKERDERLAQMAEDLKGEKARVDELEAKMGRPGFADPENFQKSIGEQFVESEEFKGRKGHTVGAVGVKGLLAQSLGLISLKSLSSGPLSAGALVDPQRLAEIFRNPDRPLRLRDIMTVAQTMSNAIEYVQETGFANLYTVLTANALAAATDIVVESVSGMYPGQTINIGGEERVIDAAGIDAETNTVTITVGLTAGKSAGDAVTSRTFAPTAELALKPQANLTYGLETAAVKTIAHWIPASRQILADASQLRSQIDSRLVYGVALTEEEQILYGDGSGENLQGLMTHPDVLNYAWSTGSVGDTKLDAIRRAMVLARVAEYPIEGVVLNPNDWADIELLKGSDGHYIWINVNQGGQPVLWRAPVVETTAIRSGEFATGAFSMAAAIYDREETTVRVAEQHADFFTKNAVAILAEERIALPIYRPEAFVAGTFDSAPV